MPASCTGTSEARRPAGLVGAAQGPSGGPEAQPSAAHTEDHPLDYAAFEGEIPQAR